MKVSCNPSDQNNNFIQIKLDLICQKRHNYNNNHNYIKIHESDWLSAGLISAVIVQLHTSWACNCTVRVIELALVALEWLLFQHLA